MNDDKTDLRFYVGVCIALLPALLLRDFTPSNELRYLSIADEAVRNHTFFAFTNHGVPYADKPPLYLWIIMLGKRLLGTHQMGFLSLFSLIPALVVTRVMEQWCRQETDEATRAAARMMLLTSGLFVGMAMTLRMDMLMCMFIVLALRTFFRIATTEVQKKRDRWLFPIYVFLAIFSKGPIGLLVPLCSSVVFLLWKRRFRQMGKYWGWQTWGILLVCCGLWLGAAYAEGGSAYLNNLLFHQTVDRAVHSFHHDGPFYYYCISIWYSIAPWSLLVVGIIIGAVRRKLVGTDLQRFFLTVSVSTFVMLSCISSKLQVYLLPAFPFMIYLSALYLWEFGRSRLARLALTLPAGVFALALPGFALAVRMYEEIDLSNIFLYMAASLLTAGGIYTLVCLYRHGIFRAIRALSVALLAACFAGGWALPELNREIGYGDLCHRALEVAREEGISRFCAWRVSRPENMDVYLSKEITVFPDENKPENGSQQPPAILMLPTCDLKSFPNREAQIVGRYAIIVF